MATLCIPRLNPAEIVTQVQNSILTGANGKILKNIFPNPKPEVLHKIFLPTLQIVYGIPLDLFYKMPVNTEIMYPQIGFLPLCNLFVYMESFLHICRVNDFEFADILYPKRKRTCRFLSAIINFIHFRKSCQEIYMKHLWEYKSSMDKMQQLHVAQQEALMKLEKLDSVPAEEQAEFKQLLEDIQELQQILNRFHQKTIAIQDGISQKKLDLAETTKFLNELKLSLVTLKEEQKMKDTVQKLKISKLEVTEKYEAYRDAIEDMLSFQMELQLYQKKI
ncbi:LOW QUALITY PROTEIN: kinetochore protein Nuf2-like [Sarcophilus harrisii]